MPCRGAPAASSGARGSGIAGLEPRTKEHSAGQERLAARLPRLRACLRTLSYLDRPLTHSPKTAFLLKQVQAAVSQDRIPDHLSATATRLETGGLDSRQAVATRERQRRCDTVNESRPPMSTRRAMSRNARVETGGKTRVPRDLMKARIPQTDSIGLIVFPNRPLRPSRERFVPWRAAGEPCGERVNARFSSVERGIC